MELLLSGPQHIQLYKTTLDEIAVITNRINLSTDNKRYEGYIIFKDHNGKPYLSSRAWDEFGVYLDCHTISHFNIIGKCESIAPNTAAEIKDACYEAFIKEGFEGKAISLLRYSYFNSDTGEIISYVEPQAALEEKQLKESEIEGESEIEREFDTGFKKALLIPFIYTLVAVLLVPILSYFTFKYALSTHLSEPDNTVTTFWYYVALVSDVFVSTVYKTLGGLSIIVMALYFFDKLSQTKEAKKLKENVDKS